MNGMRLAILALGILACAGSSTPAVAQFYGGIGYGPHHHSGIYAGYSSGGYYPYNNVYASPYRVIAPGYVGAYGGTYGYTTSYGIGSLGYGPSYLAGGPVYVAPNPVYGTTTTIIRGGPTGGVVTYSNNGTGYTYVPDSTYPTVIQQQPTLGLSRTYVPQSPPPVVIENRPQSTTYGIGSSSSGFSSTGFGSSTPPQPFATSTSRSGGTIKLICPKTAASPLTYSLNGHVYTIQPGFSQTFRDDRAWTLEFKRGGEGSEVARISLKAGTYQFVVGARGWDLEQPGPVGASPTISDLPPAPLPDLPSTVPDLSPTPTAPPTPLPPP